MSILEAFHRKNAYWINMKKTFLFTALCLGLLATAVAQGGGDRGVSLFNGRNLDGWHQLNGHAKYTVENGEIVGTTVAGEPNSFLVTDQTYGDFILDLEFKVAPTMNSGIQIRSDSSADYNNYRVHGYQVEIDPAPRAWSG